VKVGLLSSRSSINSRKVSSGKAAWSSRRFERAIVAPRWNLGRR
jgi:hypothetical protein